jgi:hypothetical protein
MRTDYAKLHLYLNYIKLLDYVQQVAAQSRISFTIMTMATCYHLFWKQKDK